MCQEYGLGKFGFRIVQQFQRMNPIQVIWSKMIKQNEISFVVPYRIVHEFWMRCTMVSADEKEGKTGHARQAFISGALMVLGLLLNIRGVFLSVWFRVPVSSFGSDWSVRNRSTFYDSGNKLVHADAGSFYSSVSARSEYFPVLATPRCIPTSCSAHVCYPGAGAVKGTIQTY